MSLHFRAEQYNSAFDSKKLQNWQQPRCYREKPRAFDGFTQIVANDRGHLLAGVKRCRDSPWGMFVGTWDMPLKIPAPLNPTARTENSIIKLERSRTEGDIILRGKLKRCKVPDALRIKEDVKADNVVPPADPFETLVTGADGSAVRSGAMCPEPFSTTPKIPPISSRAGTPKIITPTLDWPKPRSAGSAGSRRSPKIMTPLGPATTNAAVAGSLDINWPKPTTPAPKSPEQQKS